MFSQEKETYFKGKDLKKYEGTWVGVRDKDTLTVILKYKEHFDFGVANATIFIDAVIGWHCYKKNGITESTTFDKDSFKINNRSTLIGIDITGTQFAVFNDKNKKNGNASLAISLSPIDPNTMIWKIKNIIPQEGVRVIIKGDTIPKYTEDDYPESKLTAIKEWKLIRVKN